MMCYSDAEFKGDPGSRAPGAALYIDYIKSVKFHLTTETLVYITNVTMLSTGLSKNI